MSDKKNGKGTTKGKGSKAVKSVAKKAAAKTAAPRKRATNPPGYNPNKKLKVHKVRIRADFKSVDTEVVIVKPGDLVVWTAAGSQKNFYVRFKDPQQTSPDDNDQRSLLPYDGIVRMVARPRTLAEGPLEAEYEIVGEGGTIDPKVIIDPMAQ